MLSALHIRHYVLIDSLDVEFPDGLVIISGPTGAGKSILIGALGLLTGARADASAVAEGSDSCVVEGEFDSDDAAVRNLCEENDLEYDGGHIIIRRTVSSAGRSRAFVNDSPVPLQVLSAFGALLVDIHSQHDTLLLTSRAYQLAALDHFASDGVLLEQCRDTFDSLREVNRKLSGLREKIDRIREESDYNSAIYSQLCSAGLSDGEIASLEEEQYRLANSGQVKEYLSTAVELLDPSSSERNGLVADLASLGKNIGKLAEYIPSFKDLSERVEAVRIELKDISSEVSDMNGRMDSDPERLQWVDDRLSLLYGLLKRHNCETEAELIARRNELAALVGGDGDLQDQLGDLEIEASSLAAKLENLSAALHQARTEAAPAFCSEILKTLSFVELESSKFEISFSSIPAGPSGCDEVDFLFSGGGSRPASVSKCASGGELSRIMLALKALMSGYMNIPTIVFDEIDTGVSGSVADRMGSVICGIGSRMQVFAITHLPQVAAKGNAHYLVEKSVSDGKASSSIRRLDGEERVMEVARMLSGSSLTPESVANARSLLAD